MSKSKQKNNIKKQPPRTKHTEAAVPVGSDRLFKLARVAVIALLLFTIFQFGKQFLRYYDAAAEANAYQRQFAALEYQYAMLEEQKELMFDDSYIERFARKYLGMIKRGEVLIQPAKQSQMPTLNLNLDANKYNH